MSVTVMLIGTNLFGGTETIYCESLYKAEKKKENGWDDLEFFNSMSEYPAVLVECKVMQLDGSWR